MCVSPFGPQRVLSGPRCASRDTAHVRSGARHRIWHKIELKYG